MTAVPQPRSRQTELAGRWRGGLGALAAALLALWTQPSPAASEADTEGRFIWAEANATLASAKTPADFLHAARSYQALVDLGIHNGPLFYNMGVALLNAERFDDAIQAFLRAERYLGRSADLELNLQIARNKKDKLSSAPEPWYRIVLFWHYGLACPTRTGIAAVAFSLFWLALTARIIGARRFTKPLLLAAAIVFILFGSSVATSLQQEATAPRPAFALLESPPALARP